MSLIPPPPPAEPTLQDKQTTAATSVRDLSSLLWRRMLEAYQDGLDLVWRNSQGLTPQQVCDGLGDQAALVFASHGALADFLRTVYALNYPEQELDLPLPTNEFAVNPDGTVTVGEGPYVPPV